MLSLDEQEEIYRLYGDKLTDKLLEVLNIEKDKINGGRKDWSPATNVNHALDVLIYYFNFKIHNNKSGELWFLRMDHVETLIIKSNTCQCCQKVTEEIKGRGYGCSASAICDAIIFAELQETKSND